MKKLNGVLVVLLLVSIGIISSILLPPYLGDYSVMTKRAETVVEINENFLGTDVLVAEFGPLEYDPYAYTSVQNYTLTRTRQKGKWDGYIMDITPTKLSASQFFELQVVVHPIEAPFDQALSWDIQEITKSAAASPNYPPGNYYKITGTFKKGTTSYEVSGRLMGDMDDGRKEAAIAELQHLIDSMAPVLSVVKAP